ncbi:MAG: hypothetical protein ACK4Z0_03565 [Sphingomonadaceae bacterium]
MAELFGAMFDELGVAPGAFVVGVLLLLGLVSRLGGRTRRTD